MAFGYNDMSQDPVFDLHKLVSLTLFIINLLNLLQYCIIFLSVIPYSLVFPLVHNKI